MYIDQSLIKIIDWLIDYKNIIWYLLNVILKCDKHSFQNI